MRPVLPLAVALGAARLVLAVAGCADEPTATLALTTGGEPDALTRAPVPTRMAIEAIDGEGAATLLGAFALPSSSTVRVADLAASRVAAIRVTASDAERVLLRGLTLPVALAALTTSPLPVFLQRAGELARMPSPLPDAREAPVTLTVGRLVVVAGGDAAPALYDAASLTSSSLPRPFPRPASALVAAGGRLLVIDPSGADWVDMGTGMSEPAPAPEGGAFADVAGGGSILADAGVTYVVGATRIGSPSSRVLRVRADGALSFVPLAQPRAGAAAAYVAGHGLVIAGGAAEGAGVEVIATSGTTSVPRAFAARPIAGAAAAPLEGSTLLLVGGRDAFGASGPTETIDLACTSACVPTEYGAPIEPALAPTAAFVFGAGSRDAPVLIVGDDPGGATHAVRLGRTSASPVPLRVARQRARAAILPTGSIALVGGATVIESYVP